MIGNSTRQRIYRTIVRKDNVTKTLAGFCNIMFSNRWGPRIGSKHLNQVTSLLSCEFLSSGVFDHYKTNVKFNTSHTGPTLLHPQLACNSCCKYRTPLATKEIIRTYTQCEYSDKSLSCSTVAIDLEVGDNFSRYFPSVHTKCKEYLSTILLYT